MSFDAEEVHIGDIPFPSVTICNLNKVRKSKWEDINAELVSDPTNDDLIAEKDIAEQGFYPCCWKIQKAIANSRWQWKMGKNVQLHTMAFIIEQICGDYVTTEDATENEDSLEISGSKLHGYLGNLSHSCDEVIIEIQFVWNSPP